MVISFPPIFKSIVRFDLKGLHTGTRFALYPSMTTKSNGVTRRLSAKILVPALLLAPLPAMAWPPTYGAEFELTSGVLQNAPEFDKTKASQSEEKKAQMLFVEKMRARCLAAGCAVSEVRGKWDQDYVVTFADGWWFKVSYDPSCVEITFKPSALSDLDARTKLINVQIFGTGVEAGFKVKPDRTSHFNMGVRSAFNDNGREFLKFFVDYANHPDLALGSLGRDDDNAPSLSILGAEQRSALSEIVNEVNSGELVTIQEIAKAIQNRVYTKSYNAAWGGANHYQAIGLKYVNRTDLRSADAPMELRSVWIQKSGEQFNLVAKLIEGRIQYLKTSKQPIVYHPSDKTNSNVGDLKTRFFVYVEETGMRYEDFESLLPARVRNASLAAFARPNARIEDQLSSLIEYQDLLSTSPWVQHRVVELLSRSDVKEMPEAKALLEILAARSLEEKSAAGDSTEAADLVPHSPERSKRLTRFAARAMSFIRNLESTGAGDEASAPPDEAPLVFTGMLNSIKTHSVDGAARPKQFVSATCRAIFD